MQTLKSITRLALKCELSIFGHKFDVRVMPKGDGFLVQLACVMMDNKTLRESVQKGSKYYISPYALDSEVIGAIWKAFQDFVIHEAREGFKYKGQEIYGPHWNVEELYRMTKNTREVKREWKSK